MSIYPKKPHVIAEQNGILVSNRRQDKVVDVRPKMPCSVIVVHGVNDVGTSYAAVEEGICAGLQKRLSARFVPAKYSNPTAADANKVVDDPDDIYFKRKINEKTFSPVIPFYWGSAETKGKQQARQGQITDRYGNRLDKDLTKGGGPFANATSTLPDMWNRGASWSRNISDDPLRPLFNAPPRRYMVLAAKRLAALIAMIRDYDPDETVNVVAHSQGCLITLLAQAFLKDEHCRPADAVIMMHPPYALSETTSTLVQVSEFFRNGDEKAMQGAYFALAGWQNLNARLQTLVNIVHTVGSQTVKPLDMNEFLRPGSALYGTVGATWKPANDRDNRRKVFLYFCPEDMTVALDNIQGIGWQGVPDFIQGTALPEAGTTEPSEGVPADKEIKREALKELGERFYQRVFTDKKRIDPETGRNTDVLVGMPPHRFALRVKGEDDLARFSFMEAMARHRPPEVDWPIRKNDFWGHVRSEEEKSEGVRRITGEALMQPVKADLHGAQQIDTKQGPAELVDPIDASTAVASGKGVLHKWELIDNPTTSDTQLDARAAMGSPDPATYPGPVQDMKRYIPEVQSALNGNKPAEQRCQVLDVYECLFTKNTSKPTQLLILRTETPNEARLRWQHAVSLKSFHGAIIGSSKNHEGVTAYDLAIGQGRAIADPDFCAYLCAVADWRLKETEDGSHRPSILSWDKFSQRFRDYLAVESGWRKKSILGNCHYYSTGEFPADVPILPGDLPTDLVSETTAGVRMTRSAPIPPKKM